MPSLNDPSQNDGLSPSLSLSGAQSSRYPNQFFDLAQQYMPPTIKELFRWCTFYYYNSPLIGASIRKISRYPITDLIFEDEHESVRQLWDKILNKYLKIKDRMMETNLDYYAYGNAFVSLHFPFTRFLICRTCKFTSPIRQWNWSYRGATYNFQGVCKKCESSGAVDVKDVTYKDLRGIKLIRWNPENMQLKFNEYTGRYIYMYQVPNKLKNAILRGDKDILEDIPLIVIEAIKARRMIRFNQDNLKHLKAPTLAEQDQGWGKPLILHVLKDMYYLYTLRRAQEAIALEHIVPFDILYPLPNGQQDPYIHTDLGSWRGKIENLIRRHRRDPNFKGVMPIPIGFGRLGGDGKALLLSPEMNYLTQTVVGGLGIPQEFLFGGLNFTGSSISLRTLENDFIQNRSQLLDLSEWIKDKIRSWMNLPNLKSMRFSDFRMADDVQRNQQVIGLNAQGKLSDQTMMTELGFDYDQEVSKRIEEIYVTNYLTDLQAKGGAKSQGEASLIQFNYQSKVQELAAKAQQNMQARGLVPTPMPGQGDPSLEEGGAGPSGGQENDFAGAGGGQPGQQAQPAARQGATAAGGEEGQPQDDAATMVQQKVQGWAKKLTQMPPAQAQLTITQLKTKMPEIGAAVEKAYKAMQAGSVPGQQPDMRPMPERGVPRRAGVV